MKTILFLVCALSLLAICPSVAEARGIMLVTYGETIKDRGELAAELKDVIEASTEKGVKMGYCYSYAGMFWIDVWTWGGAPCFYKDKRAWKLSDDDIASYGEVAPAQVKKPFFYRFPEGLLFLGSMVLLIGISALRKPEAAAPVEPKQADG